MLWTVALQTPLSMGFSRQEYWSGVPLPSPVVITRSPQRTIKPDNTHVTYPVNTRIGIDRDTVLIHSEPWSEVSCMVLAISF